MKTRLILGVCLPILAVSSCFAGVDRVKALYESLLLENSSISAPAPMQIIELLSRDVPDATAAELFSLTPVMHRVLQVGDDTTKNDALMYLITISSRIDIDQPLSPYLPDLIAMLDTRTERTRSTVIRLLGGAYTKPSPTGLAALSVQLESPNNTPEQFSLIAGALLSSLPRDPANAHRVLASVRRKGDSVAVSQIISVIGLASITDDDAIAFVREGFANPLTREAAVESVRRFPGDVRARFDRELQRVAEDPDERPGVRSAARYVLMLP
jgi:hypothetical protein